MDSSLLLKNRPVFQKLIGELEESDLVMVTKIDRCS
jgi:DNA invertase Pin-like site-specific DNA recombinase